MAVKCKKCGQSCANNAGLAAHMRTHNPKPKPEAKAKSRTKPKSKMKPADFMAQALADNPNGLNISELHAEMRRKGYKGSKKPNIIASIAARNKDVIKGELGEYRLKDAKPQEEPSLQDLSKDALILHIEHLTRETVELRAKLKRVGRISVGMLEETINA